MMNFNLDASKTQTPAATSSTITFGGTASSTIPSFGMAAPTTASSLTGKGFSLANQTSAAGGFSQPGGAAPANSNLFNLAGTTTTTSSTFSLGGTLSTATSGFNIGNVASSTTSGLSLGKSISLAPTSAPASTSQTSLSTATTVSTSTASKPSNAINFSQLEESINKWTLELEEQEKVFVNQAMQINVWDKLLIANGEKIVTLNEEVERVKLEQQQLEHELDYIVGQQKELQDCLMPLEKELAGLSVSDPEREYTYHLAENIDTQLKQMSEDLKEIIEHLNEANRAQDSSDPVVQIVKILNAHMNSLQWLVQRGNLLSQKIQQIDQMHQNFRQENERSFSLAYN